MTTATENQAKAMVAIKVQVACKGWHRCANICRGTNDCDGKMCDEVKAYPCKRCLEGDPH